MFVVGLFGTLANQFLKILCRVPRPWVLDPGFTIVESARAAATGYSFPSGHTQNAVGHVPRRHLAFWQSADGSTSRASRWSFLCRFRRNVSWGSTRRLDVGAAFLMAGDSARGVLPHFPLGRKNQRCHAVSSRGGHCAGHRVRLLCQRHPRVDFAPGSEDESNLAHAVRNAWTLLGAITGLLSVFLVDRKTLRFETRAPLLGQILKFVLGLALVAGIKAALKPLFYAVLPSGPADCLRYYLVVLLAGIVWPRTFSFWAKLGAKKEA